MSRPGRRLSTYLVARPNPTQAMVEQPILAPEFYLLPPRGRYYPLKQFDQLELYVSLLEMPEGASYVDITLFGFQGEVQQPVGLGSDSIWPGQLFAGGGAEQVVYLEQFLFLDTTNDLAQPIQQRIRLTTASPAVVLSDLENWILASRFSYPVEEDYIGWLIQTDGASGTGAISLWAVLGAE